MIEPQSMIDPQCVHHAGIDYSGFNQILSVVKIGHHSAFGTRYFLPRGNLPRVFRGGSIFSKSIQSYDWTR